MKKPLLITLLVFFAGSSLVAQEVNNTFKINPLSALLRVGSVFYERKVADNGSLQLGVAYTGLKLDDTKFTGLALTPEYRYFPKANALSGVYLAPFLRYQNYKLKENDNKGSYSSFGGGALIGRQWVFKSNFTLDLFFGPSFNSGKYKAESGDEDIDISGGINGFGLRTGLSLGLGF
ncbi:DUF3575 domain-containing protein [Rubrolithibacter danxiaensis]|uniref:DUF3575 domain-containing protein n=1 Tax=Rubrolithibacter danxiaensis TaxID=3390805 RepID=UPI003BF83DA7